MIRRAFLRRMASAAMAGMLGLELVSRAPKVVYPTGDPYTATYPQWSPKRIPSSPLTEETIQGMIDRIREQGTTYSI